MLRTNKYIFLILLIFFLILFDHIPVNSLSAPGHKSVTKIVLLGTGTLPYPVPFVDTFFFLLPISITLMAPWHDVDWHRRGSCPWSWLNALLFWVRPHFLHRSMKRPSTSSKWVFSHFEHLVWLPLSAIYRLLHLVQTKYFFWKEDIDIFNYT